MFDRRAAVEACNPGGRFHRNYLDRCPKSGDTFTSLRSELTHFLRIFYKPLILLEKSEIYGSRKRELTHLPSQK